jgi:hypothetical protein
LAGTVAHVTLEAEIGRPPQGKTTKNSFKQKKLSMVASTCYPSHRGGANRIAQILEGFASLPILKIDYHLHVED